MDDLNFVKKISSWGSDLGIRHELSSKYNPSGNGLFEAWVRMLKEVMKNGYQRL